MQRLNLRRVALVAAAIAGIASDLWAHDLPPKFRVESEERIVRKDRATRPAAAAGPGEAEMCDTMRTVVEFQEVAPVEGGARGQMSVIEWSGERTIGSGPQASREPLALHLVGCVARIRWDAAGRPTVEEVVKGDPPAEERELLALWDIDGMTRRTALRDRRLEAGQEWTLRPEEVDSRLAQPAGAAPGIEDWKETLHPAQGVVTVRVERVEGELAYLRATGDVSCSRDVSGREGKTEVAGTITAQLRVNDAWTVDRRRLIAVEQRQERTTRVLGKVGGTEWEHTETVVGTSRFTF